MNNLWKDFEAQAQQYSTETEIDTFNYSINISLKYNYLYTETPKVACSSIKSILQRMELDNPYFTRESFEDIHDRDFSPLLRPCQLGSLKYLFNELPLFKFCFVRNPYTRLLSAYIDKIQNNKQEKSYILRDLGKDQTKLNQDVSFEEFINIICNSKIIHMNSHWRVQYYQTFQNKIEYDFIGKFENLDADIKTALKKINPDYQRFISDEKRHATNANELLQTYYTPELTRLVQKAYAKDFTHFGYDFDIQKATMTP